MKENYIELPVSIGHVRSMKISKEASLFIAASRVDQALCDEIEKGRVHGSGYYVNGCWFFYHGMIRMNINTPSDPFLQNRDFQNSPAQIAVRHPYDFGYYPVPFDFISKKFMYLFASISDYFCWNNEVNNEIAIKQIKNLGSAWKFTGNWGDKNRLETTSNWYEDKSLLTVQKDYDALRSEIVNDHNGCANYIVEIFQVNDGEIVLPMCYLRRNGFPLPRLFYAPPVDNIAIWYKNMPTQDTKEVFLTRNHILMQYLSDRRVVIGCLPGDTPSINKTALHTLHDRKVYIIIADENDEAEVKFAITLADKLSEKYISVDIVALSFLRGDIIDTQHLAELARKHNIFFPERLRSDYYGDITLRIKREEVKPLIHNVINADEAIFINTSNASKHLLASHIATKLGQGVNVFEQNWVVEQAHKSAVFIDQISKQCQEYYKSCDKICDSRFVDVNKEERMRHFDHAVGDAKVVLINSQDLIYLNTDICKEVIEKCLRKDIAVLLFGSEPLPVKLRELVSHTIMAESIERNSTFSIKIHNETDKDSIEVVFNENGELQSAISCQEEINDYTDSATLVRSASPDFSKFKLNVANSDNSVHANNRGNFWNNF